MTIEVQRTDLTPALAREQRRPQQGFRRELGWSMVPTSGHAGDVAEFCSELGAS